MNIITGDFVSAAMERSQSVKDPGMTCGGAFSLSGLGVLGLGCRDSGLGYRHLGFRVC